MSDWHLSDRGIKDERVLDAMLQVPRDWFVPDHLRDKAYGDYPLPIGFGQTISQPYIVASMTALLATQPEHRVLEIGTGSGYQTAILACLVAHVYSIEVMPALSERACATLERLCVNNATLAVGDGYGGWPEFAPYDRIILTAAPLEVPSALYAQLKVGGRLVAPVGKQGFAQDLVVATKTSSGIYEQRVMRVSFVPMVHPD